MAGIGSVIQNLFGGASTTPAGQPPVPGTQGGPSQVNNPNQQLPGTHASNVTAANGMIPSANPGQQPAPGQEQQPQNVSPLDGFKDLWNTPTVVPGTPDPNAPIFSQLDPVKVMEAARKQNFTQTLTPEVLAKINAGGAEATQALMEVMNSTSQHVYAQNAMATAKIVEQALEKQADRFNSQFSTQVKRHSIDEGIRANNALLSNPAVAPVASAVSEMLIRKNPNATAKEIETQVGDFFSSIGQHFAPKVEMTEAQKKLQGDDWSKFLE